MLLFFLQVMHPFPLKIVSLIIKELEQREFENKKIYWGRRNIMKALSIGLGIFILTSSVWAGTFVETFDDNGDLEKWQELTILGLDSPGLWNIDDGELRYILDFDDGGFGSLLTTGDEMWQDYSIEFDVKPLINRGEGNIAIAGAN